jgi:ribulose kinase
MNIPVSILRNVDAAELGASILINVGTGTSPDFSTAIHECDLQYDKLLPDPQNIMVYKERYAKFLKFEKDMTPDK